jgi:hypothetical protein
MSMPAAARIEERLRSAFPDGAITQVEVLSYGDDPAIEPGQTAIRVSVDRSGRPEGREGDEETIHEFEHANHATLKELHDKLPRFIEWAEFRAAGAAGTHGPILRIGGSGGRSAPPLNEAPEELTPVMTRLGTTDLATVDLLITAGIGSSRAEVMRWAVGRIRENPVYSQIQERVREIEQLKAEF